jgi:hypothetical protein
MNFFHLLFARRRPSKTSMVAGIGRVAGDASMTDA